MPILKFRITANEQNIIMPKGITAQNLIFKRAVVIQYAGTNPNLDGGLTVHCSFINGYTILTNSSDSNDLSIPLDPSKSVNDVRFDLSLGDEIIKPAFNVRVLDYGGASPVSFLNTDLGALKYVDIFFEYNELFNFETY